MTSNGSSGHYDAILVVGFGGPEGPDDVMPFLENVTRGRNIPRERLLEVAGHYAHFGGVSPINGQVRSLIAALRPELDRRNLALPIYWGNRNWHPMLADTMRQMAAEGVRQALAVVLAAYSSYSSCRQYRENLEQARGETGPTAPRVDKVRVFFNHPGFIAANAANLRAALALIAPERRGAAHVAFTAHSIPSAMAENCQYAAQLTETSRLVAEALDVSPDHWRLVYQSRSGRPTDPWLEPDVVDHLRGLRARGFTDVVVHPIGFLSDHLEVLYDLDEEARHACEAIGMNMVRAATVGTHPEFVAMLGELVEERVRGVPVPRAIGCFGPSHDVCPLDCCPAPERPRLDLKAGRPAT